jgi:hypothetical protein
MAYNEEKEKSHESFWGLGSFNFIYVLGAPYYQGGCIGWVSEVQIIENTFQTNFPKNPDIFGLLTVFQEAKPDMSSPQPRHVRATLIPLVLWTYLGPLSGSSKQNRTCMAPGPDMSDHLYLSSG